MPKNGTSDAPPLGSTRKSADLRTREVWATLPNQKISLTPSWIMRGALALRTYPKFAGSA
jgi:hypothetical protein